MRLRNSAYFSANTPHVWGIMLLLSVILAGCATYKPKPLHQAAIDDALKSPLQQHSHISPITLDFSRPLTPSELAVIAVLVNPDLKAVRAKNKLAQAQVFDAGLLPDPQLAASYDVTLNPMIDTSNAYSLAVTWDIGGLFTRHLKLKNAQFQQKQIHYDVAWQEWLTANQARLLAERVYYLKQQAQLMQQFAKEAKQLLAVTQQKLLQHEIKIDEFGLRQVAYLDAEDQAKTLEGSTQKARLELNKILALPPEEKIPLSVTATSLPARLDAAALFVQAQTSRLDLMALKAGYQSQEVQLYQAVLGQFPRFNIGITRARDNTSIDSLGPSISFDLPIFNRNRGTIAIARATREQLYWEYMARLHQTRADIAALVADLSQNRQEQALLLKELPSLQKAAQVMQAGLKSGNITLVSYQGVLNTVISKRARLLSLQQNGAEQMIALQLAVGRSLL